MVKEQYELGKPLSRKGLFQLVTDEVFKDGKVEKWENSILNKLAKFLSIKGEWAQKIAGRSAEKYKAGELGTKRPLNAMQLYERALFFVWSDGVVDEAERKMLQGLRMFFNISSKAHDEMLRRIQEPDYVEKYRPQEKPLTNHTFDEEKVDRKAEQEAIEPTPETAEERSSVSRADFELLSTEVRALFSLAKEGKLDSADFARAEKASFQLGEAYRFLKERRRPALTLLSQLAPALVSSAKFAELTELLLLVQAVDDQWDGHEEIYHATLLNCLLPLERSNRPDDVVAVLKMARKVVKSGMGEDYRWSAFADLCAQGGKLLAKAKDWKSHEKVLYHFAAVPEGLLAGTACQWANTLSAWISAVREAGRFDDCWKGFESFLTLTEFLDEREVRKEYAKALRTTLEYLVEREVEDLPGFEALLEDFLDLSSQYLADPNVCLPFARLQTVVLPVLFSRDDLEPLREPSLAAMEKVLRRHKTDSKIACAIAKSGVLALEGAEGKKGAAVILSQLMAACEEVASSIAEVNELIARFDGLQEGH